MNDELYELVSKLPKKNIINLMLAALDEMQLYNGRTKMFCIMEALGAECTDEDNHARWKRPTFAEIKRNTDTMGL